MKFIVRGFAFLLIILLALGARIFQKQNHPTQKLIVILADGIRWDYLDDPNVQLKGFPRLASSGVKAEYLIPIYPSNSYPNWYSILTGLYAENHGFVENVMYDSQRKELFLMSPHPNASHEHWWNDAEPIWITAEKRGIRSAVYWWDGCQVKIKGKTPTVCEPYFPYWFWTNVNQDTKNKLIQILNDFQEDKYRLSLVYYEAVDAMGHAYGPKSKQCKQSIQDIDNIINTLLDEISSRKLEDEVNIIIISDHGMTSSKSPKAKVINVSTILDPNNIEKMLNKGAISMIVPVEGKEEKVYQDLKQAKLEGLRVYKKEDIPEKYHLKNHRLVQKILLMAEKGYYIQGAQVMGKMFPLGTKIYSGNHGYDPNLLSDMRGIFYATGTKLKKGYKAPPLKMVDQYNLMCHIIGLGPLPNNGSWDIIQPMLSDAPVSVVLS